jgi:hypothetical protein
VTRLSLFLEENEEVPWEELEKLDILKKEETETAVEEGNSEEACGMEEDLQKCPSGHCSSMADEERL